ncbi:hypothetical protein L249_5752 [Ophiocordyceps polyrhachis-furcata BCC 54312]|uniref:Uncharacterized protein n=1 Tax=Ophiocordyceps polyrhachis-furcata BCC 54312 TaxID=1330021 RepID=A0A367KZS5_9HYPO|nr:hypothetical protein L249_5752 [Ophiocordyceps polyrhachis-furcata BCC 54312]
MAKQMVREVRRETRCLFQRKSEEEVSSSDGSDNVVDELELLQSSFEDGGRGPISYPRLSRMAPRLLYALADVGRV